MKKIFLFALCLVAVVAIAAPAHTIWLTNQPVSASAPTPSVNINNRNETDVTFTVRLNGFSVQPVANGVALRVGGDHESLPSLGDPDISGVTVFLPFNAPIRATTQVAVNGVERYSLDQIGGSIATATDPEISTPASTMSLREMPRIIVGDPSVFRDFGVLPITIFPVRKLTDGNIEAANEITVKVAATFTGPRFTAPIPVSFNSIYETMFLGYPDFSIGRSKLWRPGTYMVIRRPNAAFDSEVATFAYFKRLEGYNVVVRTITETNPTTDNIRQAILNEYNTNTIPLEYVLLLGDVDRTTAATMPELPTYSFTVTTTEVVPTDLNYVVLDNNGFWPFALLGRMSYGSLPGFATIVKKTIRNQHFPYTNFPNGTTVTLTPQQMWRALCFAGNYGEGSTPITPTENTKDFAQKLRDHGYSPSLYLYPPSPIPGTDSLMALLNSGLSLVTYRGWGDSQGPLYPRLQLPITVTNSACQAVFLSIVCQNGRYAGLGSTIPNGTCFGESWCELGSTSQPRGGPAFFGASHLHTSTRYNNPILGGYGHGWLVEKLDKLGLAALRGKIEVYRNFPLPSDETMVSEYFKFYNILGDPSLQLWVGQPETLRVQFPTSINPSTSSITVRAMDRNWQPIPNMVATVIVGSTLTGGRNQQVALTDIAGNAFLPLQIAANDTVTIEVRGKNFRPQVTTLYANGTPSSAFRVDSVRFVDGNNGFPEPGESANLQVYVKNVSSTAAAAQMTLSDLSAPNRITIGGNTANGGTVNANASVALTFSNVRINSIANASPISMRLTYSGTTDFAMPIGFCFPYVTGTSVSAGDLNPGHTATVQVNVKNQGTSPIPACNVLFGTWSNGLQITNPGWHAINAIARNDSANIPLSVTVSGNIMPGQVIPIRMAMSLTNGPDSAFTMFNLTCGTRPANYPTGPDLYGYYAYEDNDTVVTSWPRPNYNWTELDPDSGATVAGTPIRLNDDSTAWVPLPFPIQFYGITYQQRGLSICSNGWVSFDSTKMFDFYNWPLPNAQGPYTLIAPNWDDLKGLPVDSSDVFLRYQYNAAAGTFIIEWARCYSRYGIETIQTPQKFELVFYRDLRGPTGDNVFDFIYKISSDIDLANNYTTVGIMNRDHTDGLDITYANSPTPGSVPLHNRHAIRFTTQRPDSFTSVSERKALTIPSTFSLSEAYPNPFNPSMSVTLSLPKASDVVARVFDRTGREVEQIAKGRMNAGTYTLQWRPVNTASGVYFVQVTADNFSAIRKVIFMH